MNCVSLTHRPDAGPDRRGGGAVLTLSLIKALEQPPDDVAALKAALIETRQTIGFRSADCASLAGDREEDNF